MCSNDANQILILMQWFSLGSESLLFALFRVFNCAMYVIDVKKKIFYKFKLSETYEV